MLEPKKPAEAQQKPIAKETNPCYPDTHRAYEKLMQHDAYKRVKGRVRQNKWGERS